MRSDQVHKHVPFHFNEQYPKMMLFIKEYYNFLDRQSGLSSLERLNVLNGKVDGDDITANDYRSPGWWNDKFLDLMNLERVIEPLETIEGEDFVTADGDKFSSSFHYQTAVDNWLSDAGFPTADQFGGDIILTSRILRSLYQIKGTTEALRFFFEVFFGESATLINPNDLISIIDDNFIPDSHTSIADDVTLSPFSILVETEHTPDHYEPLFSEVYLKMFHPAGFKVVLRQAQTTEAIQKPQTPIINVDITGGTDLTKTGIVSVKGLQGGNIWEYTTDGGISYVQGFGFKFKLLEGYYADNQIGVRQKSPSGVHSDTAFLSALFVEYTLPPLTVVIDASYKKITGRTLPRVVVDLLNYDGTLRMSVKSDSAGVYRMVFRDGVIPNGDYVIRSTSAAGNVNTESIRISYLDRELNQPILSIPYDTGISNKDYITKEGKVQVQRVDSQIWEYTTDGGRSWNTGSGSSFRLKHGDYSKGQIQARTRHGAFYSIVGVLDHPILVLLLMPKIEVNLVEGEFKISAPPGLDLHIYKNGARQTIRSIPSDGKLIYPIVSVNWDEYRFEVTDLAGNLGKKEYTVQIL